MIEFQNHLQLTAVSDLDLSSGSARVGSAGLDLLDHVHTLNHSSENDVSAVQVGSGHLDIRSNQSRMDSSSSQVRTVVMKN